MAELVNISQINPITFEYQDYSIDDSSLITSFDVSSVFNPTTDYLEYFIYDLNGNILFQNVFGYPNYTLSDNNVIIYPEENLKNEGFTEGQYNTVYNFLSRKLASNNISTYYISEISSDRTEIRLDTTNIPNDLVISSSLELINDIQNSTGSYYDFYLDFGSNQLVIANNALLDTSSIDNPTVLIKLYDPLPSQFDINSQVWVVTQLSNPVAYTISIIQTFDDIDNNIRLKGPNTNIDINNQINNSTDYVNYQSLTSTSSSLTQGTGSLNYQLNNILAQKGIVINIDYSNYANFVNFSSAQTRLENFYYKLQLLEQYTYSASLSNNTPTNYYVSSSNIIWQAKIDEIITGFDPYEYYLYYSSGSTAWPKTSNTPPYINYSTTSTQGENWFVSQSLVAEEYDSQNNNALINTIPSYLREDSQNAQYELFIEMIGQYFDTVFLYTQDVTNKYNADNRLDYGISKDLVADVLRDLGIKIYQNNFSSNDVYQALIGITPSGSLYNLPYTTTQYPVPTGSFLDYITTYVTASSTSSLIPTDDINKAQYKRIYHNLPLLLKKKGSVAGLRDLITAFGIPNTILRINEFGGKDRNINSFDNWQNEYNYSFYTSGSAFITSSFVLNSSWGSPSNRPQSIEFRFKTDGLPQNTSSVISQSLWSTNNGVTLQLRYTGSGYSSGSYSGSIIDPYYQYALLEFIPNTSSLSTSASIYLPFYDGGWWSVLVNKNGSNYTLHAANKNYEGEEGNVVGFQASSSVTGGNNWTASLISTFGSSSYKIFTGSFQEIRYYTQPLSQSNFDAYVMNPYSTELSDYLAFRATLGGELYTASVSVHPKVTGSWVLTSSFASNSIFFTSSGGEYIPNTEYIYFDQVPAGIQNAISDKIKQQNIVLPYSSSIDPNIPNNTVLSPFISIQQFPSVSSSYTRDIDYVEVGFSPQNEINEDINSQIGYFNIGELIGDPRFQSSSLEYYPDLDALQDNYFKKYESNYDWTDYIRLIEFYDNSLFKTLKDWSPARTSLASGIIIKNTLLNRSRYRPPQVNDSSSLAFVGSGSGALGVPYIVEDQIITGSIDVGTIEGGNGGVMPNLLGETASVFNYPNVINITQSWTGSTPSLSGSVLFTESSQAEFYNGELSGSDLVVTNGNLTDYTVINPIVYTTSSFSASYTYPAPFYTAGVDQGFPRVTQSGYINYDFNFDKTYYLSFTATVGGGVGVDGLNLVIVNSDLTFANGVTSGSQAQQIAQGAINLTSGVNTIRDYEVTGLLPNIYFLNIDGVGNNPPPFNPIIISNFTVREATLSDPNGFVIENDVEISRPSSKFFDVDFSTNAITAVNEQAILSGSATPATVPDSYYTTARIINPRYVGSQTTSPTSSRYEGFVNQSMTTGSSIGAVANVEQYCDWFAYFDNISPTNYSYLDVSGSAIRTGAAVHITSLININGEKIDLNPGNNLITSGSSNPNPLISNIPTVQSVFPYNLLNETTSSAESTPVSIRQYIVSGSTSVISGSFSTYNVAISGIQPLYYAGTYNSVYGIPNETIVVLRTGSAVSLSTQNPGLLIPGNFNPNYTKNLLQIAQEAGFFKNI